MASVTVSLKVAFRWWAKPALYLACFGFGIFGKDVPENYVVFVVRKGCKLEIGE